MSGGGGGKGFCSWACGDGFVSCEVGCFLGHGKKGMKVFGGGVLKQESLEFIHESV